MVAGISAGLYFPELRPQPWIVAGLCVLLSLYYLSLARKLSYSNRWITGLALTLVMFLTGMTAVEVREKQFKENHFSQSPQSGRWIARVLDYPSIKTRSVKVIIEVVSLEDSGIWKPAGGRIMLYLRKSAAAESLVPGNLIAFASNPVPVAEPGNPGEFDYKRYLERRGIYHTLWLDTLQWQRTESNHPLTPGQIASRARNHLLSVLSRNGITGEEFAVASAILLGYSDFLDDDLRRIYSGSGAMHVLCVSGLHVGIVYMVLAFLTTFLKRWKRGPWIRTLFTILAIWIYAMITGLSPSVTRAATMFSFVAAGNLASRKTNIYNTLAASAFFILLFNPFLIAETGFQLSYAAVLGIVSIQPGIYKLLSFKNYIADKTWALLTVSLAAQIGTFPLALYYFHQFPVYFLLTNLVVIPLSTVIMALGVLFFVLSPFSFTGYYAGKALAGSLWVMNRSAEVIENLPGSVIHGISLTGTEVWLTYGIVFFTVAWFITAKNAFRRVSFLLLLAFVAVNVMDNALAGMRKEVWIFKVSKEPGICFLEGKTLYMAGQAGDKKLPWKARDNPMHLDRIVILPESNLIAFSGKTFLLAGSSADSIPCPLFPADFLILSGKPRYRLSDLKLIKGNPVKIVADASVPAWIATIWENDAKAAGIDFHSVALSGAFKTELSGSDP